jgi:hypothetical protein
MNRLYIFSFILALTFAACNSASNEGVDDNTDAQADVADAGDDNADADVATLSGDNFEIAVIKADLPSPRKEMTGTIGENTIKVNYGSPSVKGRQILGNLIPYGEIWRMGANEATTIELTQDIKIQGKELAAGKYAVFTQAEEKGNWTVIFNSESEQWGHYKHDADKDVLRVEATAETRDEASETMDFVMEGNNLVMIWEKVALPLAIEM